MNVEELIKELSSYNQKATVSFCTSPFDALSILSVYEDSKDNVVWFDLEDANKDYNE